MFALNRIYLENDAEFFSPKNYGGKFDHVHLQGNRGYVPPFYIKIPSHISSVFATSDIFMENKLAQFSSHVKTHMRRRQQSEKISGMRSIVLSIYDKTAYENIPKYNLYIRKSKTPVLDTKGEFILWGYGQKTSHLPSLQDPILLNSLTVKKNGWISFALWLEKVK